MGPQWSVRMMQPRCGSRGDKSDRLYFCHPLWHHTGSCSALQSVSIALHLPLCAQHQCWRMLFRSSDAPPLCFCAPGISAASYLLSLTRRRVKIVLFHPSFCTDLQKLFNVPGSPGSSDVHRFHLRGFLTLLWPKPTSWLLGWCLIPCCCFYCFPPTLLLLSVLHPVTCFPHPFTFFPISARAWWCGELSPPLLPWQHQPIPPPLSSPVSCSHGDPVSGGPYRGSQWQRGGQQGGEG